MRRVFASLWGGDNPLGRKPNPAPLLAVLGELGEGPQIYVSDSEIDSETARRALSEELGSRRAQVLRSVRK